MISPTTVRRLAARLFRRPAPPRPRPRLGLVPLEDRLTPALAITPAGLNPGDQFTVLAVSVSSTRATSGDVATYDSVVATDATGAGVTTFGSQTVTWQALVSTTGGAVARDRFFPTVPVYRMDGTRLANNGATLWNNNLAALPNRDLGGSVYESIVWTGSATGGFSAGTSALGTASPRISSTLAPQWQSATTATPSGSWRVYAVSNVLTYGDVLTVTTAADVVDEEDGVLSLREAIFTANANPLPTAIRFAPELAGQTVTLTQNDADGRFGPTGLMITTDVRIDGSAAPLLRISGNDQRRVFGVTSAGSLTLTNLEVTDGSAKGGKGGGVSGGGAAGLGGGVFNQGTLTATGVTFTRNAAVGGAGGPGGGGQTGGGGGLGSAGGNANGGGPNGGTGPNGAAGGYGGGGSFGSGVNGGAGGFGGGGGGNNTGNVGGAGGFGGGGGGAYLGTGGAGGFGGGRGSGGDLSNNGGGGGAGLGGAIFNESGTVDITNSTFTGNSVTGGTGANNGKAHGGAVFSRNGQISIVNSTLSLNTAADGGRQVYVLADGGEASVVLRNSILGQADTAVTDYVSRFAGGDLGESGFGNLVRTSTGFVGAGTLIGNPQLGPLAANGGPTRTMAITEASPAYNAGANDGVPEWLTTDQRGTARVKVGRVDIGAFEATPPDSFVVTTASDVVDGADGVLSLREAVAAANADANQSAITFAPALTAGGPATLTLTGGQLVLTNPVTITGPGATQLSVSGGNASRVFRVEANVTATLSGLTITGGKAIQGDVAGGGVASFGTLTITHSTVANNTALDGGGVASFGTLTIIQSTFADNTTTAGAGGGVTNEYGTLTISQSTFAGNSATFGGGVASLGGTLTIGQSTFAGNTTDQGAAGIFNGSSLTLANSLIVGNSGPESPDLLNLPGNSSFIDAGGNLIGLTVGDTTYTLGQVVAVDAGGLPLLADNGGPTQTVALVGGGPAVNAGLAGNAVDPQGNPLTTDQRGAGFSRAFNGGVDVGAFELNAVPAVVQSAAGPAAGRYNAGDVLEFTITYDEAVTVTGVPTLTLALNGQPRQASYFSGSGTTVLTFRYTVVAGDNGPVSVYPPILLPGGATVTNSGLDSELGFTLSLTGVVADTTAPAVQAITRGTPAAALTNAAGVTFAVAFTEPVRNLAAANFALTGAGATGASIGAVSPAGPLDSDGAIATWAVAVATGADGPLGLNLTAAGTVQDAAGNGLGGTLPAVGQAYEVDRTRAALVAVRPVVGGNVLTAVNLLALPAGTVLPWAVGGVVFAFDEGVTVPAGAAAVNGTVPAASGNGTAGVRFDLGTAVQAGPFAFALTAAGVTDAAGNAGLQPGPTANAFTVFYGDVSGDGRVTSADLARVAAVIRGGSTAYDPRADLDGDGDVDAADLAVVRGRIGQ